MGERDTPLPIEEPGLFESILDAAPDAILLVDELGRMAYANEQAVKMFGHPRDRLVGRFVEMLVPERFRARHPDHRELFFQDPKVRSMGAGLDLFGLRADDTEFPVEISLSPVTTKHGTYVLAAVRDVTDRKAAETRFRDLLEAAPDAMVIVDRGGRIVVVNRQTERLFGWRRDELLGEEVEVLVPRRFVLDHKGHRDTFMDDPKVRPMGAGLDLWGARKDGTEFPVEISLGPLRTPQGLLVLAAVRDATDTKEAQRRLREAAEELEASNEELERFAYIVSHDLQEPLRTITGFIDLIHDRKADGLDDEGKEFLSYVQQGAGRMRELIADLLHYSRVGTSGAQPVPVHTVDVVQEVVEDLRPRIDETGATLHVETLPDVRAERTQLRQVFQNLIGNGLKFRTPDTEPEITVSGTADEDGGMVRFTVTDNGIGIHPRDHDRVFLVFQRLHERDRYEGTGIGLAVVKKIVERHGGQIGLESEVGKGTTVWFTLPSA